MAVQGIIGIARDDYSAVYDRLGKSAEAKRIREEADRLQEPYVRWEERRRSGYSNALYAFQRSGMIHSALVSGFGGPVKEDELAPGRLLEHVFLEQGGVSFIMVALVAMMLGALIITIRWRWTAGELSASLLLLPSWKVWGRILGLAVLLPISLFYFYTRWSGLAGREYSLGYMGLLFMMELILLITIILFLTGSMTAHFVRQRCQILEIPVPQRGTSRWRYFFSSVMVLFWVACLIMHSWAHDTSSEVVPATLLAGLAAAILGLFLMLYAAVLLTRFLSSPKEYRSFYATLAQSLLPVLAGAAILIGVVTQPYLTQQEIILLQNDHLLPFPGSEEGPFAHKETKLVRKLQKEVRAIAAEIEAERASLPK